MLRHWTIFLILGLALASCSDRSTPAGPQAGAGSGHPARLGAAGHASPSRFDQPLKAPDPAFFLKGSEADRLPGPVEMKIRKGPQRDLLYATTDGSSLLYSCKPTSDPPEDAAPDERADFVSPERRCRFERLVVRRELEPDRKEAEFAKRVGEGVPKFDPAVCEEAERVRRIVLGELEPESYYEKWLVFDLAQQGDRRRASELERIEAQIAVCKDPTPKNWERMVRFTVEQDARTCFVHTAPWTAYFERSEDGMTWTAKSEPEGPCGVVDRSRFELQSAGVKWVYVAEKEVTQPKARGPRGQPCSQFAEPSTLYVRQTRELQLGCEIVTRILY